MLVDNAQRPRFGSSGVHGIGCLDIIISFSSSKLRKDGLNAAAERLTRELLIDFRANSDQKTTRVDQALETLQGILFSVRSGRLAIDTGGPWTLHEGTFGPPKNLSPGPQAHIQFTRREGLLSDRQSDFRNSHEF